MSATVVNGNQIAAEILADLKARVAVLKESGRAVSLAVVLVGSNAASSVYVRNKGLAAEIIGVDFKLFVYPSEISTTELVNEIKKIQGENQLDGLIIQLPLPKTVDSKEVINQIAPEIDVDGLTAVSAAKLVVGEQQFLPPTPAAILEILKYHQVDLKNKKVVMIGKGELVGKPLAAILTNQKVDLIACDRSTPDISVFTREADVIITGAGSPGLLTGEMIKPGAVVLDAGFGSVDGKSCGDIDFPSVAAKASLVTPTPGGVGPVTVAKLLANTVKVAENRS
ncbi:MAG: bifunctional 5,10-methylenetetrahydrofolate dehydrogenase/5,10-methenyltetrahydrofolate cyclohydrolase [Patescibacteria group bacterium]|jgi:methylenetetrahydrofolate dehydrogenase (NADP+)/methenyltetrahydrofolate cyclohydrolase